MSDVRGGGGSCLGVMGLPHQRRSRNFLLSFSGRRAAIRHSSIVARAWIMTMMVKISNVIV